MEETEIAAFSPYLSRKFMSILKKYYAEKVKEERTKQQLHLRFSIPCATMQRAIFWKSRRKQSRNTLAGRAA